MLLTVTAAVDPQAQMDRCPLQQPQCAHAYQRNEWEKDWSLVLVLLLLRLMLLYLLLALSLLLLLLAQILQAEWLVPLTALET